MSNLSMQGVVDSVIRARHMDELDAVIGRLGIPPECVCVVGGAALALTGIRENNDVDIVVLPEIVREVNVDQSPQRIGKNVDLYVDWAKRIGITDEDLIVDSRYHTRVNAYRVARPELVFAYKNARGYAHDRRDVEALGRWALSGDGWDWSLCRDPVDVQVDSTNVATQRRAGILERGVRKLLSNPSDAPHALGRRIRSYGGRQKRRTVRAIHRLGQRLSRNRGVWEDGVLELASTGVLAACPVARLVNAQYRGDEFNRYDLAVRWLAIEQYFGRNDHGFPLYNKMQDARGHRVNSEERFRCLIESVCREGLDDRSSIEIDAKGRLGSGAHRLTLAIYLGIPCVQVRLSKAWQDNPYGLAWFEEHGFSEEELGLISETCKRMFEHGGLYFHMLVWPPAMPFFREISGDLGRQFHVARTGVLTFGEDEFHEFVKSVYRVDDIAEWKVAKKLWGMREHPKRIGVVSYEVLDPRFRRKTMDEDAMISVVAEELKKTYRERYAAQIPGYFYDISLHIGDNYRHNRELSRLLHAAGSDGGVRGETRQPELVAP